MTSTAFVWILTIVVILSLCIATGATVLVYRTSTNAIRALNWAHERNTEHTNGLVDRIVAGDYNTYKAYEISPLRGPPEKDDDEELLDNVVGSDRGGFGSRLGIAGLSPIGIEEEMLKEHDEGS